MATERPVRVKFIRDLSEPVRVGNFLVDAARGPVRQRQARPVDGGHPLQSETSWATLQPGEERLVPPAVAEVLKEGGYVEVAATAKDG